MLDISQIPSSITAHGYARERRRNLERHPGVVPLAVSGRSLDDRIVIRHAGLLRSFRETINIGHEANDR